MKHKLMLGLVLSSLLSANSFAIEFHGGKLLSHKEWTKGNVVKSSFKDLKDTKAADALKKPSFRSQQNSDVNVIRAFSLNSTLENNIATDTDVSFTGTTAAFIQNNDSVSKVYTLTSMLWAQPACSTDGSACTETVSGVEDRFTLDPQGTAVIVRNPYMTTSFSKVGMASHGLEYTIKAEDSSTTFEAPGVTEIFTVTDAKK